MEKNIVLKELRQIPGIGTACAHDLWNIGIRKISDLKNKNPIQLYHKLNFVSGMTHDVCMLYTFRCAVYYACTKKPDPKKLNWWYWKDKTYHEKL